MQSDLAQIPPFGPIPSARQMAWHRLEYYGFLHFSVNTFTNREWGLGNESPDVFNPRDFSASQIAKAARDGGMKGLILTAKHHDGFCLWPSDYSKHSVKFSSWRDGKGDVVGELAQACADLGLKFGVYLSPWDRNHPEYARPAYVTYYHNQLRELLTRYGPMFEVWFDGANGGDGYYGGKYEKRTIDAHAYYQWDEIFGIVRQFQPEAVIFGSEAGADIRWVGNEGGIAGDPCWHTFPGGRGEDAGIELLNRGVKGGEVWFPAECDVSIRPGWFYHRRESTIARDPRNLLDLYYQSVGRGANLLLNIPPDRRGRIPARDAQSLKGFRKLRESLFANDLAKKARASASSTRPGSAQFLPGSALDGSSETAWCAEEGVRQAELALTFDEPVTANRVSLREYLPLGQRVDTFTIDVWRDDRWVTLAQATAIGNRRLARFEDTRIERMRLNITSAMAAPVIAEFSVYFEEGG